MTKFPLLVVFFFIGASAFAQTQTEKEIKVLLIHKWKPTKMEQDGQDMPVGDAFLDIRADGTFISVKPDKQEKGKWSYDHTIKTITFIPEVEPWRLK